MSWFGFGKAAAAPAEAPATATAPAVPRLALPTNTADDGTSLKSARKKPHRAVGDGTVDPLESARIKDYVTRRSNESEEEKLAKASHEWNAQLKSKAAVDVTDRSSGTASTNSPTSSSGSNNGGGGGGGGGSARTPTNASTPPPAQRGSLETVLEYCFAISGEPGDDALGSDAVVGDGSPTFTEPAGVTSLPDGELCVADTKKHRLVILTPEGQPRAYLHGGEGKDALRLPRGVTADETHLYVSEVGGSRLRKLRLPDEFRQAGAETPRGSHLGGLSIENGSEAVEGQLTFPQGVTHHKGLLLVCDCEEHAILVYDAKTLRYLRSFGQGGAASPEEAGLYYPYDCVVVGEEVLVADAGNHRIASYSFRTGAYVRSIDAAKGRYAAMTPRAGAKAAQLASMARLERDAMAADMSPPSGGSVSRSSSSAVTTPPSKPQLLTSSGGSGGGGGGGLRTEAALRRRMMLLHGQQPQPPQASAGEEAEPPPPPPPAAGRQAGPRTSSSGSAVVSARPVPKEAPLKADVIEIVIADKQHEEEQEEEQGQQRATAARAALAALKQGGVSGAAAVLRAQQYQKQQQQQAAQSEATGLYASPPPRSVGIGGGGGVGSGSGSALSEAVRRMRTTPSPPRSGGGGGSAQQKSLTPVDLVPGGLSVLGRGEKLEHSGKSKASGGRGSSGGGAGGGGAANGSFGKKSV